jgi:hypothetical protein
VPVGVLVAVLVAIEVSEEGSVEIHGDVEGLRQLAEDLHAASVGSAVLAGLRRPDGSVTHLTIFLDDALDVT